MRLHLKLRTSLSLCALSLLVLMLLAHVRYDPPLIQHSREAVLKTDLRTIRDAIDNYTLDKQEPPHSLQDLVDAGYLRNIPTDPITLKPDWMLDFGEPVLGDPVVSPGLHAKRLVGVHSGSNQLGRDGTKYRDW